MKTKTIILGTLFCLLISGCTSQPKQSAVIGSADTETSIVLSDQETTPDCHTEIGKTDSDTILYELPQCQLWYTKPLPEKYQDKKSRMWTEYENYWEDVQAINVFVTNPTNTPYDFGRHWNLYVWNEKEWITPPMKVSMIIWEDDLLIGDKAPLLFCFRFPIGEYYHLPKGKYRITKTFRQKGEERELTADFTIK